MFSLSIWLWFCFKWNGAKLSFRSFTIYNPPRVLRSSSKNVLTVPFSQSVSPGDKAFSVAAPKLWNNVPLFLRSIDHLILYKSLTWKRTFINHIFQINILYITKIIGLTSTRLNVTIQWFNNIKIIRFVGKMTRTNRLFNHYNKFWDHFSGNIWLSQLEWNKQA